MPAIPVDEEDKKNDEDDDESSQPFDESMKLQSRLDTSTEKLSDFPAHSIPDWWQQGPNSQFLVVSCNGRQYKLVQRKFSRQFETADMVSRSGMRVYYENTALDELLFGESHSPIFPPLSAPSSFVAFAHLPSSQCETDA